MRDRQAIYDWLARSDLTASMLGPPHYPDAEVPTWDAFCADYTLDYFDDARPERGRSFIIEAGGEAVGHVSYAVLEREPGVAELDVWMRAEAFCGQGYGTDALRALTGYLHETCGLTACLLRPSGRNARAIRAYLRAGFSLLPLSSEEQDARYGPGDYPDAVVLYLDTAARRT